MRSNLIIVAGLSATLIWSGDAAFAGPASDSGITVFGNAPIGHLQPRPPRFSPDSSADKAEQQRMSRFDAEQQRLGKELDKHLNICRC
jgi:hypothetical protein